MTKTGTACPPRLYGELSAEEKLCLTCKVDVSKCDGVGKDPACWRHATWLRKQADDLRRKHEKAGRETG